ncbi:Myosin-2 [Wickerhamomyces ciferrii]|uniref:Myosin-2 n=1 Tax=Wickerhamomyces ciferrii (strain ATCC 14091 / BCRC 22168 / CBS 111 / JCM 3599 / NBRC 0793 / NRRL Y-1031 F-60-10) TaxID=1206466 RepID=K0KLW6_WICCF|nr:Myosin-2 [Wickerhamomyces ciferrii]CCH42118.1 Myosin-2 [Wickerhamomyces ciferrii]
MKSIKILLNIISRRCWVRDDKLGWIGAEITKHTTLSNKHQLELSIDSNDDKLEIEVDSLDESNENLPLLRNPPILEATEDLTSLSYLNEPAVLHAIKVRYSQLNIYTYSGIVLIATNPFQRVDQFYSSDIIQAYSGKRRGEQDPHLFAIAEDAYRCMKNDKQNQTIVVSGESGAGKTVSAKYIMRYFATVEEITNSDNTALGSNSNNVEMSEVEQQILATNPIMEAFGNAKTTRNDNSSRFGKYLEILFNDKTAIIGARIRTYLLERSRLVFQPKHERNYHIFYQVLEGLSSDEKEKLKLTSIEDYNYLNQGGDYRIENVDEVEEYKSTTDALSLIGINKDKQFAIFQILAALLHIGNIEIKATRNNSSLSSDEPNLIKASELLGIDAYNFAKWITKKQITTRSEKIVSDLNHPQALVARDSVAKYIYSALFDWLVSYINTDLCNPEVAKDIKTFIGVLDIYGFEHFEKNSFEQFCINYANEKLQQEFNQHVFKLEQEEYVNEKIEWSFIEFSDNQPCIDLIEKKLGILSLLDEESRLPAGNDESWVTKLYQTLDKPPTDKVFKKPRFGQTKFIVSHYALDVTYDIEGFIEKNRDTVSDGHLEVLKESKNELLVEILDNLDKIAEAANKEKEEAAAAQAANKRPGPARTVNRKPTLGSMFKNSLIELMSTINSTNVHYIRCIKPNEEKAAWKFDPLMVLSQLRACGVLETIKISCAGFPSRWTYEEFGNRYHVLLRSNEFESILSGTADSDTVRQICDSILKKTVDSQEKYQLGLTKIFFKAGMLAHLEKLRTEKLHNSATLIQKIIRKFYYRRRFLEARESIIKLQSLLIGFNTRNNVQKEIENNAATSIQTLIRGYIARKYFTSASTSIIALQGLIRAKQSRITFLEQQKHNHAIVIQKSLRSFKEKSEYQKLRKAAVLTQSAHRSKKAKIQLKQLKADAKSVNKLKEASYKLENKVIELTTSLTTKVKENKSLTAELESLKQSLEDSHKTHEDLKTRELGHQQKFTEQADSHSKEIEDLNNELNKSKVDLEQATEKIKELTSLQTQLKNEVKETFEQLNHAKDELLKHENNEDDLKKQISTLKNELDILTKQVASGRHAPPSSSRSLGNNNTTPKRSRRFSQQSPAHDDESNNYSPKPVSVIPITNQEDDAESTLSSLSAITNELYALLQDSKTLHTEIVQGLLKNLKIPMAGVMADLTKKEVLFPARIMIIILSDMWRLGLTKESEEFLGEVLGQIQSIVHGLKDDDIVPHGAFWLSNTHELYSFVSYAEMTILENETISSEMGEEEYQEYLKLVAVVKEDFDSLSYNIYNMWMRKMEKDLEKKVISAVVLSQSLPGFMTTESAPLFSKMFSQSNQYKMDDILSFFNNVYWAMKTYYIEPEVMNEVIIEILRYIDAVCFNDLIMKRNYLSWKRGLQLNYNVTRIEEWCKSHEIPDASNYLIHLLQAAKLLQLRKGSVEDIEIIFEICYALKPVQVQKLLSQYAVADYEAPLDEKVLGAVAERVKTQGSSSDDFFEPVTKDGSFKDPFRLTDLRPFSRVEAYVPAWLNLPKVRRIVELVTKNAAAQEYLNNRSENGEIVEEFDDHEEKI